MVENKQITILSAFDEDPDIDDICDFVSNGGSLVRYCNQRSMPFGEIRSWINKSDIRKQRYNESLAAREDFLAQNLCNMIYEIVRFDPRKIRDPDTGHILPMDQWPAEAAAAMKSIKVDPKTGNIVNVEWYDRPNAAKLLGSTIGMFAERIKVEGTKSLSDMILEAGGVKNDSKTSKE